MACTLMPRTEGGLRRIGDDMFWREGRKVESGSSVILVFKVIEEGD